LLKETAEVADVEWSDDEEEEPAYAQGLTKITALWQPKPKAVAKDGRPVSLIPPEAHFSQVHVDEKESPGQNSQGVERNRTHAHRGRRHLPSQPPHPAPCTSQAKKARLGPFKERNLQLVEGF
jgi:hypothetical protein